MHLPVFTYTHACGTDCPVEASTYEIRPHVDGHIYLLPALPICVYTGKELVLLRAEGDVTPPEDVDALSTDQPDPGDQVFSDVPD